MIFEYDKYQLKKLKKWQDELIKDNANIGAIGGRFKYIFIPTGIGVIAKVVDEVTKQELDLTDFDNW